MPPEELKLEATETTLEDSKDAADYEHDGDEQEEEEDKLADPVAAAGTKKKRSKRKRIKAALMGSSGTEELPKEDQKQQLEQAVGHLNKQQITDLLSMNPGLARDLGISDGDKIDAQALAKFKTMSLQDIMTGLAAGGKNVKDMASYKFWQTQPVPKLGESRDAIEEGPFKIVDPEKVPKEPAALPEGFEWVTMDLLQDEQLQEVCDLLYGHYVEDTASMFRLNYSKSFLNWALLAPGWSAEWHIGVRAATSKKLVAFISGVPASLRVRNKVLRASEINFLCIHKKLRSKRLAPVLIKEITRRCYLRNIYQAIYTAGIVLPTPVSTSRYFHRSLDWQKLYEVGFSPLPANSKPAYQIRKYALPESTTSKGLRPTEEKDVDAVLDLLKRYLARFDMAPVFTREEVEHWLVYRPGSTEEQVVWSYVVEDPTTQKITDFVSFYNLESTIISSGTPHKTVKTAYLYYYATEAAFPGTRAEPDATKANLKARLNSLVNDALILAKRYKFDVFNALSMMDNALFLEDQKFGKGDGQLHYYLYNYNSNPIAGGVDRKNELTPDTCSGVGIMML